MITPSNDIKTSNTFGNTAYKSRESDKEIAIYVSRLAAQDKSLTHIDLSWRRMGDTRIHYLTEAIQSNITLSYLDLDSNDITNLGAIDISYALRYNTSLVTLRLLYNNISDAGAIALSQSLRINKTLKVLTLWRNKIGDVGATALSESLYENTSLVKLVLGVNNISDEGAISFAKCLTKNSTLTTLNLQLNQIQRQGAESIANSLRVNESLIELNIMNNNITEDVNSTFEEALHHNSTLCSLDVFLNRNPTRLDSLKLRTEWNQIGGITSSKAFYSMPQSCRERLMLLILLMYQLPLDESVHWKVLTMLKFRDIVDYGNPTDKSTWKSMSIKRSKRAKLVLNGIVKWYCGNMSGCAAMMPYQAESVY